MDGGIDLWMDWFMNGLIEIGIDGSIIRCMEYGWMDDIHCMDNQMNKWMGAKIDEQLNVLDNTG